MALKSIATYAREAYKNRYAFDRVTINKRGEISGHWTPRMDGLSVSPTNLGLLSECHTSVNPNKTGLCFYNRHHLVYTFELPAGAEVSLAKADKRYTVTKEGTGDNRRPWVVRFDDCRVDNGETEAQAWERAGQHKRERDEQLRRA